MFKNEYHKVEDRDNDSKREEDDVGDQTNWSPKWSLYVQPSWADVQEKVLEVVPGKREEKNSSESSNKQPEAFLLTDTLMKSKAVLKTLENKETRDEGEPSG